MGEQGYDMLQRSLYLSINWSVSSVGHVQNALGTNLNIFTVKHEL